MADSSQTAELRARPGQVIDGKYHVERVLGSGGMGVVVAATDRRTNQQVAVKLMLPELANSPGAVQRFLREAKVTLELKSDHVARVHEVGRDATGALYIAMELLEGEDLSQLMLRHVSGIPVRDAVALGIATCRALIEAHARGVVHRDLKPANLFIAQRPDGSRTLKVLDFGVSKLNRPDSASKTLTQASDSVGSPLYMSPEQMRSPHGVDARADVWAVGNVLYELLTGRPPFLDTTVPQIYAAVLTRTPPAPRTLRPDIPEGLENVLLRCLEKDPQARVQSALELGNLLTPFLQEASNVRAEAAATRALEAPGRADAEAVRAQRLRAALRAHLKDERAPAPNDAEPRVGQPEPRGARAQLAEAEGPLRAPPAPRAPAAAQRPPPASVRGGMPAARPPAREAAPKPGAASNPRPPGIAGMDVEELMVISKGEVVLRLLETFRSPNYRPPRLPAAAMQLLELTRKPDVAVTQVVALLQNEQLLAAEVLKLAQSVRYSGSSPVRTLDEAIVRLGLSRTGDLFLEAALNMRVFRAPGYNDQMDRLRKHSSAVAQLARLVSRHTAVYDEHAYLCGLLHDIGIAAALIAFAELGPRGGAPPFELVWPGIFEAHEECAGVLARMWQLPSEIALVVSHHHEFYVGGRPHPTAAAVCLAGAIAEDVGFGFGEPTGAQAEDAARVLQLDGATLERIRRSARDLVSTLE